MCYTLCPFVSKKTTALTKLFLLHAARTMFGTHDYKRACTKTLDSTITINVLAVEDDIHLENSRVF